MRTSGITSYCLHYFLFPEHVRIPRIFKAFFPLHVEYGGTPEQRTLLAFVCIRRLPLAETTYCCP